MRLFCKHQQHTIMSAEPAGEIPENGVEVHEWSAFYDDEGRIYYYNSTSGESSWDPPEKFNPPPETAGEPNAASTEGDDKTNEEEKGESSTTSHAKNAWVAYHDEEGREYYFNTITEETTWDKPEGFEPSQGTVEGTDEEAQQEQQEEGGESPIRASSPIMGDDEPPTPEPEEPMDTDGADDAVQEEEPEEPAVDPAIQRLEEARAALKQTDAIMEPGSYAFAWMPTKRYCGAVPCMILDRICTNHLTFVAWSTNRCSGSCHNGGNE